MPTIDEEIIQNIKDKLDKLEQKINKSQTDLGDLSLKLNQINNLLKNHTHSGIETSGRLEPQVFKPNIIDASAYKVGGTAGLTGTITVRNSAGTGTCTITVVSGIITATTC